MASKELEAVLELAKAVAGNPREDKKEVPE